MYIQIETEFREKSKIRQSHFLYVLCVFFISFPRLYEIVKTNKLSENFFFVILGEVFLFYLTCYIFMFCKTFSLKQRKIKAFLSVSTTIKMYKNKLLVEDMEILKNILVKHKINTLPKIKEAIRHYQCLLPRKVFQTGQLMSILALAISTIALFTSETIISSIENIDIVVGWVLA